MNGFGQEIREPSVSASLAVLAAEIELAGARSLSLDRLVGEVMGGLTAEHRGRLVQQLHEVDMLTQHLASLSAFARALGEAIPPAVTAPVDAALGDISLGALAQRMAAGLNGGAIAARAESGELDLF